MLQLFVQTYHRLLSAFGTSITNAYSTNFVKSSGLNAKAKEKLRRQWSGLQQFQKAATLASQSVVCVACAQQIDAFPFKANRPFVFVGNALSVNVLLTMIGNVVFVEMPLFVNVILPMISNVVFVENALFANVNLPMISNVAHCHHNVPAVHLL